MRIATYDSLFGKVNIATQDGKLIGVTFGDIDDLILYLRKFNNYIIDNEIPPDYIIDKVLDCINHGTNSKLNIFLFGTQFQKEVWDALQNIPFGTTCSYQEVANMIGKPKTVRAVANAIGTNPIAILVPCHRVIRSNGDLGGYRWGKDLKKKLLEREALHYNHSC